MTATRSDWALMLGLGLIWGASFMANKVALEGFAPLDLVALRLCVAAMALGTVALALGTRPPRPGRPGARRFWLFALGMGMASNVIPFTALSWGQRYVDSALAGVFMATVPLFTLPLAHLFVTGERMTPRRVAGFVLGFLGVLVLIGPDAVAEALSGVGQGSALVLAAQGAFLVTALGYASGGIISRRAAVDDQLAFGTAALLCAAVVSVPIALLASSPPPGPVTVRSVVALVSLGLLPTALATVMLLTVIRSAGPGFLSLTNYQVPVWAVLFGWAVLGETPSPRLGLALVLILAGLAVAQGRAQRLVRAAHRGEDGAPRPGAR